MRDACADARFFFFAVGEYGGERGGAFHVNYISTVSEGVKGTSSLFYGLDSM